MKLLAFRDIAITKAQAMADCGKLALCNTFSGLVRVGQVEACQTFLPSPDSLSVKVKVNCRYSPVPAFVDFISLSLISAQ